MNRLLELSIVVVGIYVFFLTWGITQERVTSTEYGGKKFKYFMLVNKACVCISYVSYVLTKPFPQQQHIQQQHTTNNSIYPTLKLSKCSPVRRSLPNRPPLPLPPHQHLNPSINSTTPNKNTPNPLCKTLSHCGPCIPVWIRVAKVY